MGNRGIMEQEEEVTISSSNGDTQVGTGCKVLRRSLNRDSSINNSLLHLNRTLRTTRLLPLLLLPTLPLPHNLLPHLPLDLRACSPQRLVNALFQVSKHLSAQRLHLQRSQENLYTIWRERSRFSRVASSMQRVSDDSPRPTESVYC